MFDSRYSLLPPRILFVFFSFNMNVASELRKLIHFFFSKKEAYGVKYCSTFFISRLENRIFVNCKIIDQRKCYSNYNLSVVVFPCRWMRVMMYCMVNKVVPMLEKPLTHRCECEGHRFWNMYGYSKRLVPNRITTQRILMDFFLGNSSVVFHWGQTICSCYVLWFVQTKLTPTQNGTIHQ